jgi:phenylalanyl-tRNA synthetase, alpha subunit
MIKEQLKKIAQEAGEQIEQLKATVDMDTLEQVRIKYLGKKGPIQKAMQNMRDLNNEERKEIGQIVNEIKNKLSERIEQKREELEQKLIMEKISSETIDITMPGKIIDLPAGFHPLNQIVRELEDFFITMGYQVVEGPEVEKDYYNFEAVNIPKDHPARDMQDTFYISAEELLRTHTSGMQARTLESTPESEFPIKIISPGKVYRRDDDDATHSHQFTQIEGMYIGEKISLADLKGTLQAMVDYIFGKGRQIRLRPSYFPFTEPSVEVDVSCAKCNGAGCSICKGTGYIEVLGSGSVHPSLLDRAGIDSKKYTGFAFGIGAERIAMLKYGVEDIRNFYTNDIRFLKQFNK